MSLLRNQTGFQFYPLTAGSNDAPSFPLTTPTTFEMKNIPIVYGDLAEYAYGIIVTFYGNVDQGGAGSLIYQSQLRRALLDSIEVRNAWHGTPVSANHVKGSYLSMIPYLGGGHCELTPMMSPIPIADADYNFRESIFIPLCCGLGDKPHYTAQLALFYKQAQLVLNPAPASVLTGISTGAVFEALTVRASVVLLPEPEIRLGPGVEFIDYQSPASTNQNQISLDAFGNVTGLSGTTPDAGVIWMGALTSVDGGLGSFVANDVTRYNFPWRGQVDEMQIEAFAAMQLAAIGNSGIGAGGAAGTIVNARAGFPYAESTSFVPVAAGTQPLFGLRFFPMVTGATNLEMTKLEIARGTQSYFLTGPAFSGTNHTLVWHARSFDDGKREDAVRQIVDSGLAAKVLGRSTNLGWVFKLTQKNDTIDAKKTRFLPVRLVKQESKRVVSAR